MRRILIAEQPGASYGMPWKGDAPCFNFKFPNEHIRPDELEKIGDKTEIESLVLGCDLSDYTFISQMTNLQQLYIYSGENLNDISFIKGLVLLNQLYISESHISSLEPLIELTAEKQRLYKEASEEHFMRSLKYVFEGVCIRSDRLDCDPNDFPDYNVLNTREFIINKKRARG